MSLGLWQTERGALEELKGPHYGWSVRSGWGLEEGQSLQALAWRRETAVSRGVALVGLHLERSLWPTLWRLDWRKANWRQRGQLEGGLRSECRCEGDEGLDQGAGE